jgi:thiamine kinase-like enzyme
LDVVGVVMVLPKSIVRSDGTLNNRLIIKRELIYKGMNGRFVERFFVTPTESYIFKPLTNNEQAGKEVWAYEHVLPFLPDIYPKIAASSSTHTPNQNWLILEDLGPLNHVFTEDVLVNMTKLVALWHSFPTEKLSEIPLRGPKPKIEEIVTEILVKKEEFLQLLPVLQIEKEHIFTIYSLLERRSFSNKLVLSHGDLHLGNFAAVDNKVVVLDWEHTHLNTPFWDLYHLIDISHPLFPKNVTNSFRNQVLNCYLELVGSENNHSEFIAEYNLFSSVFSIWMILLISKDFHRVDTKWSSEELNRQLAETVSCLRQCAEAL